MAIAPVSIFDGLIFQILNIARYFRIKLLITDDQGRQLVNLDISPDDLKDRE